MHVRAVGDDRKRVKESKEMTRVWAENDASFCCCVVGLFSFRPHFQLLLSRNKRNRQSHELTDGHLGDDMIHLSKMLGF